MKFQVDVERAMTFFSSADRSEVSRRRRAAWDLGDVLRDIIDRLVDTRAGAEDLETITGELQGVAAHLGRFDHGRRYDSYAEASVVSEGESVDANGVNEGPPSGHVDFSPLLGRANPLAPPMRFAIEDDMVVADVEFGHAYEGPPGHVHGGIVAAAFDELLGATQALSGSPGMTGQLTISYRAPTPLNVPLRLESTLDSVEGRKILTSGRLYAGDQLCAEATGLFISVDFAKIAAMRADRDGND